MSVACSRIAPWAVCIFSLLAFPVFSLAVDEHTVFESKMQVRSASDLEPGELELNIRDNQGHALAARVVLRHVDAESNQHIDMVGRGLDSSNAFFVDGSASANIAPGRYELTVRVGQNHEYVPLEGEMELEPGQGHVVDVTLHQWFDPNSMGWYSADFHTHSYRPGDIQLLLPEGEAQFEVEHARLDGDRVDYGLVALAGRSAGLDLVVDNVHDRMIVSESETRRVENQFSTPDSLLMISSEVKLNTSSGHINVPGTVPGLYDRTQPAGAFRIGDLRDQARAEGGVLVYTHPLRIPWLTRMTASEMFSHIVKENHGELFDIGPASTHAARIQLFGFWNMGVRIAAAATSDQGYGRGYPRLIGAQRTYIHADQLTPDDMLDGIRQRRTIAADGPIFANIAIGEIGPGQVIEPGTYQLDFSAHALRGLDTLEVIVDGEVVTTFDGQERIRFAGNTQITLDAGSYVSVIARDGHGRGVSVPTAIFAEGAPRDDKYATIMSLSDLDRRSARAEEFFVHLVVTVNAEDRIERVELLKDGQRAQIITPNDGTYPENADFYPIIGGPWDNAHQKSWRFWPNAERAQHLLVSLPVDDDAEYQYLVHTQAGRIIDAGTIAFQATSYSWQGGLIQLFGDNGSSTFKTWAYSDVPGLGDRVASTSAWNPFGSIRTSGRQGAELRWHSSRIDEYEHPITIESGSMME